jgi:KipI family sensor histidine kinase inhibitor
MFPAPLLPLRFERYGDRAYLARVEHVEPARRADLLAYLRAHPSVADVALAEQHVMVVPREGHRFEQDHAIPPETASAELASRSLTIAIRWAGPDLVEAAAALHLAPKELTRTLMDLPYTVSFLGFLPGFAYLRGLPKELELPRRSEVRARVPPRSFAMGGPYVGIYPQESPGGWWLLGEAVGFEAFVSAGPDAGPTLRVGDRVRLEEAP